ncbi:MAG: hypothetical protein J6X11_12810, partial [Treponema sp.]|nr:hypothetical protein [Treponema sp.]
IPPWLGIAWQERLKHACKEKSLHGLARKTKTCLQGKIPPWLDIPWQETITFPALAAQRQAARRREQFPKKDIC